MKDIPMTFSIVAIALAWVAPAFAADATIGAKDCLVINPNPLPKETVKWSGPCKDGYAHGEGDLEWFDNGAFSSYYKGTLERGLKHGTGYRKGADGVEYEGSYQHGQREGKGVMLFPNGDRYEGDWKAGAPDGVGTMVYALGGSYAGQWQKGRYAGVGKTTYAGGQQVDGTIHPAVTARDAVPQAPKKAGTHALKDENDYNWFKSDLVTGGDVPYDKSYAQMTEDERQQVKSHYALLLDGDEPPYPLQGTKRIFTWFGQALEKVQASGTLRMDVLVDSEGNAESVTVHASPHPDMSKLAAQIVMAEKYKPAVCSGKPCAMAFPYAIKFVMH
jgi:hypothetical protein